MPTGSTVPTGSTEPATGAEPLTAAVPSTVAAPSMGAASSTGAVARLVPHALSALRVPLGVALPFLARSPGWFTMVLVLGVLSDVADGWAARRLGVAGPGGARLDSAVDTVFYLGAVVGALAAIPSASRLLPVIAVMAVAMVRLAAATTARVRFGQWASIHTWANRAAGAATVLVVLWLVWAGQSSQAVVVALVVLALATIAGGAAVAELWIVATSPVLDPDRRWSRPPASG